MTPTLLGRWQTRIFLLATVGILFSLPFYLGYLGHKDDVVYFWVVFYLGLFGLAWDILYNYLQGFLWDHDWPGIFIFFSGIVEGIFLGLMIKFVGLPGIDSSHFDPVDFLKHYSLVWLAVYIASWVLMRLLFPRARFRGGQWLGKWSQ